MKGAKENYHLPRYFSLVYMVSIRNKNSNHSLNFGGLL